MSAPPLEYLLSTFETWLQLSTWLGPGCWSHLRSEPEGRRSFSSFFSFSVLKSRFQIKIKFLFVCFKNLFLWKAEWWRNVELGIGGSGRSFAYCFTSQIPVTAVLNPVKASSLELKPVPPYGGREVKALGLWSAAFQVLAGICIGSRALLGHKSGSLWTASFPSKQLLLALNSLTHPHFNSLLKCL